MKQQHHPVDTKVYAKGANRDIEDEFISQEGVYYDAVNMRSLSMDGDNAASKKIKGEQIKYPSIDNRCNGGTGLPLASTYECIGVAEVNGNIVEFWADAAGNEPSFIRINGLIVCMSDDFPITTQYPLQVAKNESCIGGEVYITDYNVPPMIFNVKDLLVNSGVSVGSTEGDCTEKYFAAFNINEHLLVLSRVLDHPVFIKLDTSSSGYDLVLGASGMPVGYYTYSYRYVTQDGERTSWSAPTPQIPVVKTLSSGCTNYTGVKTISKDPDIAVPSVYGVHVRLRVNNEGGYDFIEIRRDRWNVGSPIGTVPISEVIGKYDIVAGEFSVVDVFDFGAEAEETLSGEDVTDVMSAIRRAKAIRYFNQRLYLMNVEYASRDVDDEVVIIDENTPEVVFPTIQNIGKMGHNDIYKATYYKSQTRGEQRGFGVVMWDEQGNWSYAKKIGGAENYQFPNRRVQTSNITELTSYFGTVKAANTNGSVTRTHEVFDLTDAVAKSNACLYANIYDGGITVGKLSGTVNQFTSVPFNCPTAQSEGLVSPGGRVRTSTLGYRPFTPVGQDDANCNYLNYVVNPQVFTSSASHMYTPDGFEPNYYAMGLGMKGIEAYPSWAKAFSVVQTDPANRVVAQGLGYYSLRSAGGALGANTSKITNEFAVYFPDLDENTGVDPLLIENIIADPTAYEIQLVSPLGFFSEVYSFDNATVGADSGVDMITYCRIITDDGQINPSENPSMGIDDGLGSRYVAFGKWRASSQFSGAFPSGTNGDRTFSITGIDQHVESSTNSSYFRIRVSPAPYAQIFTGGDLDHDDAGVQNWHEPIYVINIVKKVSGISDTNITNYRFSGHYQKIEALVGISDNSDSQSFILVDERWEDCIPDVLNTTQNGYSSLLRFVTIEDSFGQRKLWLNIDNLSAPALTVVLNDLQANGSASVTDASGTYVVFGVYSSSETSNGTCPEYFLNFNWFNTSYNREFFVPEEGDRILVVYDNRIPIRSFGGDSWIGESVWAVKDKVYNKNGNPLNNVEDPGDGNGDLFRINVPMPYRRFKLNPRIYIINNTDPLADNIQDNDLMKFDNAVGGAPAKIRQLIAMWTAETRICLPFAFNDEADKHGTDQFFALKNYVMRPYKWSDAQFAGSPADVYSDNKIQAAYLDDYGSEYLIWGYGGFRFRPQTNIDYSNSDNTKLFSSVPKVGFEEQSLYCTRIVWSDRRPINVQDTPSVRTFPSQNAYDLSDDTGEIKFAWSAVSNNSNNLYAFTDGGVAMLLVDKRVIYEINANELATAGSDIGGILNEIWISRSIGMSDEMWRSAAEYDEMIFFANKTSVFRMIANQLTDIGKLGYHSVVYGEYIKQFGPGYSDHITGAYNVLNEEYWITFKKVQELIPDVTHNIDGSLYVVDSIYDPTPTPSDSFMGVEADDYTSVTGGTGTIYLGGAGNGLLTVPVTICLEDSDAPIPVVYWDGSGYITVVTMNPGDCYCFTPVNSSRTTPFRETTGKCDPVEQYEHKTLVFGNNTEIQMWQGRFDYDFDKYLYINNLMYGMRDAETYELGVGRIINGELIEAFIVGASSIPQPRDKEFVRIRVNSDNKPVKIEFYDNTDQYVNDDVQAELDTTINPLALKNYYGFEQYIPRRIAAPYNRMQGRLLLFKIMHNLDEDFKVISTEVQYKPLK